MDSYNGLPTKILGSEVTLIDNKLRKEKKKVRKVRKVRKTTAADDVHTCVFSL